MYSDRVSPKFTLLRKRTMNNIRLNYIPENNSGLNTRYAGGASLRLSSGLRPGKLLASTADLSTANVRSGANTIILQTMQSSTSHRVFCRQRGNLPFSDGNMFHNRQFKCESPHKITA